MFRNVDQKVVQIATVMACAVLYVLGLKYPSIASKLENLAVGLGCWQLLPRHGDIRARDAEPKMDDTY